MKIKDMPSVRGKDVSRKARERLRNLWAKQRAYLEPGQVQDEIFAAYMAGYRHGRKIAKDTSK